MNRSIRTILIIIGILSILAGALNFLRNRDDSNAAFGIFIGVSLVGVAVMSKNKEQKE